MSMKPIRFPLNFAVLNANVPGAFYLVARSQRTRIKPVGDLEVDVDHHTQLRSTKPTWLISAMSCRTASANSIHQLAGGQSKLVRPASTLFLISISPILFGFGLQDQFPATGPTISSNGRTRFPGPTESTRSGRASKPSAFKCCRMTPGNATGSAHVSTFADFLIGRCAAASAGCTLSNGAGQQQHTNRRHLRPGECASIPYYFRATALDAFVQDDFKVNCKIDFESGSALGI